MTTDGHSGVDAGCAAGDRCAAYALVNLDQRSPAWLEWRNEGIGASDAPAIMGENPWKTPDEILREKTEGCIRRTNARMARGVQLEDEARKHYEQAMGTSVNPACLQSTSIAWLRASVDGLSPDGTRVVEIKCGESAYRYTASNDTVPRYYFGQLQHVLAVTGLDSIDYWCYLPGRPFLHIGVARDADYIRRLLVAEREFWERVCECRRAGIGGHRQLGE